MTRHNFLLNLIPFCISFYRKTEPWFDNFTCLFLIQRRITDRKILSRIEKNCRAVACCSFHLIDDFWLFLYLFPPLSLPFHFFNYWFYPLFATFSAVFALLQLLLSLSLVLSLSFLDFPQFSFSLLPFSLFYIFLPCLKFSW